MVPLLLSLMLNKQNLQELELEGSFNLGRISENLNRLNFGANFTYIYSDVEEEKSDAQKSETNFSKKEDYKVQLHGC